jgi:two-component system response regulator AtoC
MVAPIAIPPLRERRQDIPLLAQFFITELEARGQTNRTLSDASLAALQAADFPGNIRDLRNLIERGSIFASGDVIQPSDLGLESGEGIAPSEVGLNLAANEKMLLEAAVAENPKNHSAAARSLGITPQALYRKLEKYGINRPEE